MESLSVLTMRHVPLERDINFAVNGPFWAEVANQEYPFMVMLISHSRGPCLIPILNLEMMCTVMTRYSDRMPLL